MLKTNLTPLPVPLQDARKLVAVLKPFFTEVYFCAGSGANMGFNVVAIENKTWAGGVLHDDEDLEAYGMTLLD